MADSIPSRVPVSLPIVAPAYVAPPLFLDPIYRVRVLRVAVVVVVVVLMAVATDWIPRRRVTGSPLVACTCPTIYTVRTGYGHWTLDAGCWMLGTSPL